MLSGHISLKIYSKDVLNSAGTGGTYGPAKWSGKIANYFCVFAINDSSSAGISLANF